MKLKDKLDEKYPKCHDKRDYCKMRLNGKCTILTSTYPEKVKCPFYKKMRSE